MQIITDEGKSAVASIPEYHKIVAYMEAMETWWANGRHKIEKLVSAYETVGIVATSEQRESHMSGIDAWFSQQPDTDNYMAEVQE